MKYFLLALAILTLSVSCKQHAKEDQTDKINSLFPNDSLTAGDISRMDSMKLTTIKSLMSLLLRLNAIDQPR